MNVFSKMRMWEFFTPAERRVLGTIVVVSIAASGVSYVRKAHPEWFLGEPTFVVEPKEAPPSSLGPVEKPSFPSVFAVPSPPSATETASIQPSPATSPHQPKTSPPQPTLDPSRPIPLNTADAPTLELLPGVGPVLAQRIIAYRNEIGGFRSVDDLLDVKGIGEKTLEKIRPYVVVSP